MYEFDSILIYLNYVSTPAAIPVPNSCQFHSWILWPVVDNAPSAEVLCLCRLCPSPWAAWHLGKLPDEIGVQNVKSKWSPFLENSHWVPLLNFEESHGITVSPIDLFWGAISSCYPPYCWLDILALHSWAFHDACPWGVSSAKERK